MNLSIYIGDSLFSEFLRKTLQCIPNETFGKRILLLKRIRLFKSTETKKIFKQLFSPEKELFPLFVTLFVHSCTSFHVKVGSFRIFSTTFLAVSKVFLIKKKSLKYL